MAMLINGKKVAMTFKTEGPKLDNLVFQTTVTIPSLKNSGAFTWLTQQDLVDAGFLTNTTENLYNKYTDLLIDIQLQSSTHSTYQILMQRSSKKGFIYSSSNRYYKTGYRHSNSTSSASAIQNTALLTANTTGYCNYSTTNGIYAALSSSYLLPANATYSVTVVAIK